MILGAATDFRPPEPGDRAVALQAAAEARGDREKARPCHGFANGCHCGCSPRRPLDRLLDQLDQLAA